MKTLSMFWQRSDEKQVLFISSMFSMALVGFRFVYTGYPLFIFLAWNLFLAFIPFMISGWLLKQEQRSRLLMAAAFTAWLLFIPNAFYIITDLFHLPLNESVPLWYDLALLLSFAWSGILFGVISVRQMEKTLEQFYGRSLGMFFILPVMFMNGLGVYIGRYLRFNSWDVIANPLQLAKDIIYLFIHPLRNGMDWGMILCYTMLMTIIYTAIKKLSKVL